MLLLFMKVATLAVVGLTPNTAELSTITANRIVQLTNSERVKVGLNPLATNAKLTAAAVEKGGHMLAEDYFAHISPSGVTPWFWISKHGYTYQVAGENLAIDFSEAENVVSAWLASPTHKDNMLHGDYTETGVGVVTGEFQGGTSTIVVHMFGRPPAAQVAAEITVPVNSPSPTVAPAPSVAPAPVVSPAPTQAPVPSEAPRPRVPRIALQGGGGDVRDTVSLSVEGDPGSSVHFLVNNQSRGTVTLDNSGTAQATLEIDDLPDGSFVLSAYSTNGSTQSDLSQRVSVRKDTSAPQLARESLQFLLSPSLNQDLAYLLTPIVEEAASLTIDGTRADLTQTFIPVNFSAPLSLQIQDAAGNSTLFPDVLLTPQFTEHPELASALPASVSKISERIALSLLGVLLLLLTMAILIRVRIQRPALIGHASFVILLSAILFLF